MVVTFAGDYIRVFNKVIFKHEDIRNIFKLFFSIFNCFMDFMSFLYAVALTFLS